MRENSNFIHDLWGWQQRGASAALWHRWSGHQVEQLGLVFTSRSAMASSCFAYVTISEGLLPRSLEELFPDPDCEDDRETRIRSCIEGPRSGGAVIDGWSLAPMEEQAKGRLSCVERSSSWGVLHEARHSCYCVHCRNAAASRFAASRASSSLPAAPQHTRTAPGLLTPQACPRTTCCVDIGPLSVD